MATILFFPQNQSELQVWKYHILNLYEPTCVGDGQPPPQEVEGPVRGVSDIAGQRFKVALSWQPAHKLSGVCVKLAIVKSVRAIGKRV